MRQCGEAAWAPTASGGRDVVVPQLACATTRGWEKGAGASRGGRQPGGAGWGEGRERRGGGRAAAGRGGGRAPAARAQEQGPPAAPLTLAAVQLEGAAAERVAAGAGRGGGGWAVSARRQGRGAGGAGGAGRAAGTHRQRGPSSPAAAGFAARLHSSWARAARPPARRQAGAHLQPAGSGQSAQTLQVACARHARQHAPASAAPATDPTTVPAISRPCPLKQPR